MKSYPSPLLRTIREASRAAESSIAIQQPGLALSYRELMSRVDAWASLLGRSRRGPGHCVAVCSSNRAAYIVLLLAALEAEVTFVPLDPALAAPELGSILERIGPTSLIFLESSLHRLKPAFMALCPDGPDRLIEVDGEGAPVSELPSPGAPPRAEVVGSAVIQFSSGSTGVPKGILVSPAALSARVLNLRASLGLDPSDITLCSVPLSHSHGMDCLALPTLAAGGKLILREPGNSTPAAIFEQIERERVTFFSSIPQFYQLALKISPQRRYDLSSWRLPFCGSAALSGETAREFEAKFGPRIRQGYGLAEAAVITLYPALDPSGFERPVYESIGIPIQGMECRLDSDGQLIVRSDALFSGYLKDPAMTAERLIEGELHTQDLVQIGENGLYFIVGRLNDAIHVSANKVYPIEIERVVATFPEVGACAVTGEKDGLRGEVPVLHVELLPGSRAADLEKFERLLLERLRSSLAGFKVPARVKFHAELPRSPLGKVLKSKLKET